MVKSERDLDVVPVGSGGAGLVACGCPKLGRAFDQDIRAAWVGELMSGSATVFWRVTISTTSGGQFRD